MHRNRHIPSIPRVTMLMGVRGLARGLRMQEGTGQPFSTHIVLNCNGGTRLGLKESKCIETVKYMCSILRRPRACALAVMAIRLHVRYH